MKSHPPCQARYACDPDGRLPGRRCSLGRALLFLVAFICAAELTLMIVEAATFYAGGCAPC